MVIPTHLLILTQIPQWLKPLGSQILSGLKTQSFQAPGLFYEAGSGAIAFFRDAGKGWVAVGSITISPLI